MTLKKPKRMIVKVQLALLTREKNPPVLVYNKSRNFMQEIFLKKTELKALTRIMQGEPKEFFYAFIKDKYLILDGFAPWQNW